MGVDDELITIDKATRLLALSEATLWLLILRGELPVVKLPDGSVWLKRNDVEEYIVNHYRTRK